MQTILKPQGKINGQTAKGNFCFCADSITI